MQEVAAAAGYIRTEGHTLGSQTAGVALFFVPRTLWPAKPDASAAIIADHLGYPIRNVSMPLWGFLHLEAGLIAVIVGFFLYGMLIVRIDRTYEPGLGSARVANLAVPLLAGYQFFLLRGDPLPTVGHLAAIVVCMAILAPRSSGHVTPPFPHRLADADASSTTS